MRACTLAIVTLCLVATMSPLHAETITSDRWRVADGETGAWLLGESHARLRPHRLLSPTECHQWQIVVMRIPSAAGRL
ncbi:MAG: hypothetical protein MJE68_04310 [Proteobacteria bacterium]|nr:hypothetical protein [Pseudomonadota bacterium]